MSKGASRVSALLTVPIPYMHSTIYATVLTQYLLYVTMASYFNQYIFPEAVEPNDVEISESETLV